MQLQWSTGVGSTLRELPNYNSYIGDCEWHTVSLNWGGDPIQLIVDGSLVSSPSRGPVGSAFMTAAPNATVLLGTARRYNAGDGTFTAVVGSTAQFEGCFRDLVGCPPSSPACSFACHSLCLPPSMSSDSGLDNVTGVSVLACRPILLLQRACIAPRFDGD